MILLGHIRQGPVKTHFFFLQIHDIGYGKGGVHIGKDIRITKKRLSTPSGLKIFYSLRDSKELYKHLDCYQKKIKIELHIIHSNFTHIRQGRFIRLRRYHIDDDDYCTTEADDSFKR
ncbi:hypothetical protein WA026_000565 [Henosepilachna vigintioctopunctata]|uniref:Homing endonuclease LAGLIDADG domain-containing protein n=1 Tax=Henosepilachna vigintioctopunctata TaxID=420089 RepID=A0AAW1V6H4_9CUCU